LKECHEMSAVLIICDDFRIGGIQRIALDQAYKLNELGKKAKILVLGGKPDLQTPSFMHTEKALIAKLGVEIEFLPGRKIIQAINIRKILGQDEISLAICFSLRATVLIFFCRILNRQRTKSVTIIEQLLSMSAPVQRIRRIIYSQFSDILFSYSAAVSKDWNYRRKHNPFIWLLSCRRRILLCRNGVYLPRLSIDTELFASTSVPLKRFIFVNRLTAWKGLPTLLKLLENPKFQEIKLLLVTPTDPTPYLNELSEKTRTRIETEVGKSISQVSFYPGDLHIYPANYGSSNKFVEGISINVLEMACLGVRSLITKDGSDTWPELVQIGMVSDTDWTNTENVEAVIETYSHSASIETILQARNIIDVQSNLDLIFRRAAIQI
jgi:glycosyltransferase involved in cell wall biosynthesis